MGRRNIFFLWLIFGLLFQFACFPVRADYMSHAGGTVPKGNGQTEMIAGVVVDYMGKLRFLVVDKAQGDPIEGASVELYIPSLNRYVLFGITDRNGVYELDVAYNINSSVPDDDQFIKDNGEYRFDGTLVYLNDNNIQYRAYKAGWSPYAYYGTHVLKGDEIPETIIIKLYKIKGGSGSNQHASGGDTAVDEPLFEIPGDGIPPDFGEGTGGIPKTGVEGAIRYWALGLLFFLLAGAAIWKLSRTDNESRGAKRRD